MNRHLARVRDAWDVLTGRKVAVGPNWQHVTFTGSGNQFITNNDFSSPGVIWYASGGTTGGNLFTG